MSTDEGTAGSEHRMGFQEHENCVTGAAAVIWTRFVWNQPHQL